MKEVITSSRSRHVHGNTQGHPAINPQPECHPECTRAENHCGAQAPLSLFPKKHASGYPHHHLVAAWMGMRAIRRRLRRRRRRSWGAAAGRCTSFRHKRVEELKRRCENGRERLGRDVGKALQQCLSRSKPETARLDGLSSGSLG